MLALLVNLNQMIPKLLIAFSACIVLVLGALHLVYTFWGTKLTPRDPALQVSMKKTSPVITDEITMWQALTGVNATHSLFLILFGLIYGYLALAHADLLFGSRFLLGVGVTMLVALLILCRLYFFSIPFAGVSASVVCFVAGIVIEKLKA